MAASFLLEDGGTVGIGGATWTFDDTNDDISTTAKIGIGTTAPTVNLEVVGDTIINGELTTTGEVDINNNLTVLGHILGHGNVGIGKEDPEYPLLIYENTSETEKAGLKIEQDGTGDAKLQFTLTGTKSWCMGIDNDDSDIFKICDGGTMGSTARMIIDGNGNVGIGTDPGSLDALYVKSGSGVKAGRFYRETTNAAGYITHWYSNHGTPTAVKAAVLADGDFQSRTSSYGGISDATLKTSINPANSQIDDIKKIEVVNFKFINEVESNGDDAKKYLGVIAQQLEECGCGSLVKEGEDGFKTVKYSILYMKAFKALQEVIAENETLKTQVADLLARVTALENP